MISFYCRGYSFRRLNSHVTRHLGRLRPTRLFACRGGRGRVSRLLLLLRATYRLHHKAAEFAMAPHVNVYVRRAAQLRHNRQEQHPPEREEEVLE